MVLDDAKAREWRTGENPARWKGHLATIATVRNGFVFPSSRKPHSGLSCRSQVELPLVFNAITSHTPIHDR